MREQDLECDESSDYDESHIQDDEMMTPFAGESISNILNGSVSDSKPFRNVVKRYWTEDEVS